MDILIEIVRIVLPASLVLYGMYLTARTFLHKDFERRLLELKIKHTDITLPLRLQAYERMTLFLERISAPQLLTRLNQGELKAVELHALLLQEIRNEFSYNLSQQVYMSNQVWEKIRSAVDNMVALINDSASEVPPDAPALQLAKAIIGNIIEQDNDITSEALKLLKAEVRNLL